MGVEAVCVKEGGEISPASNPPRVYTIPVFLVSLGAQLHLVQNIRFISAPTSLNQYHQTIPEVRARASFGLRCGSGSHQVHNHRNIEI